MQKTGPESPQIKRKKAYKEKEKKGKSF